MLRPQRTDAKAKLTLLSTRDYGNSLVMTLICKQWMHSWAPGSFLWWCFGVSSYLKFNFQILSRSLTHSKKCWPGIRCLLQEWFGHHVLQTFDLCASCWMHAPLHLNMVAIIEKLFSGCFPACSQRWSSEPCVFFFKQVDASQRATSAKGKGMVWHWRPSGSKNHFRESAGYSAPTLCFCSWFMKPLKSFALQMPKSVSRSVCLKSLATTPNT